MTPINIGGVPEHFNLPWHIAIAEQQFQQAGIALNWTDYPGGTGAMTRALRSGELDIAILLTEGIVADIVKGNPSKIISFYTDSPLIWGIHVAADSPYQSINDIQGKRYAISRFGSGSHLMAFVDNQQRGWDTSQMNFEVVGGLEGARKALKTRLADVFMWERFMTKPLVDAGEFRLIDTCVTPWPCFAVAVREEVLKEQKETIEKILKIIQQTANKLKQNINAATLIANRYGLLPADAAYWLTTVEWTKQTQVQSAILENVLQTLKSLNIIEETRPVIDIIA